MDSVGKAGALIVVAGTMFVSAAIAPKILDYLNKDEKDLKTQIFNTVAVIGGCLGIGVLAGTIISIEQNQIEILRILESNMEEAS